MKPIPQHGNEENMCRILYRCEDPYRKEYAISIPRKDYDGIPMEGIHLVGGSLGGAVMEIIPQPGIDKILCSLFYPQNNVGENIVKSTCSETFARKPVEGPQVSDHPLGEGGLYTNDPAPW